MKYLITQIETPGNDILAAVIPLDLQAHPFKSIFRAMAAANQALGLTGGQRLEISWYDVSLRCCVLKNPARIGQLLTLPEEVAEEAVDFIDNWPESALVVEGELKPRAADACVTITFSRAHLLYTPDTRPAFWLGHTDECGYGEREKWETLQLRREDLEAEPVAGGTGGGPAGLSTEGALRKLRLAAATAVEIIRDSYDEEDVSHPSDCRAVNVLEAALAETSAAESQPEALS